MISEAPYILALDISKTCTGVCEGRVGQTPSFHSIRGSDVEVEVAAMRLGLWLIDRTKLGGINWVFIEAAINPAAFMGAYDEEKGKVKMTSNPDTTLALAEMAAVAKFVLGGKQVRYRNARVQTIRKSFIGHGNLKGAIAKPRVRRMCQLLGWEPRNNDESDAAAVWYWAGLQVAPHLTVPITPMMQQRVAGHLEGLPINHRGGY